MNQISDNFIKRYCGLYALYYIGLSVLLAVVAAIINWDSSSSMGIVIAMIAAYAPGEKFVKDHGRPPEKYEKRLFAIVSTLIAVLLPLVPVLAAAAFVSAEERAELWAPYAEIPPVVWLVTIPVVIGICYLITGWGFSSSAKRTIKFEAKKAEKLQKADRP